MNIEPSDELYQLNMQLMHRLYPHYTPVIEDARDDGYAFEPGEGESVLCKQGDAWIHGPQNPWASAQAALDESNWTQQRLFIVLRPGLGYLPLALYRQMRKGRDAQRILIVDDRPGLLGEALKRTDWTDMLRSDRVIYLLHADPVGAILHFFQTNPSAALQPICVLSGSAWNAQAQGLVQSLQAQFMPLVNQVFQASQQYMKEINQYYEQRDPSAPRKALMVEPEHEYLSNALADGLKANGCETAVFNANQRLLNFLNPYVWLIYTREQLPDMMIWMNRNTLSPEGASALESLPIKKALWFLDSPKRVQTTKEELDGVDEYFTFDASYLPYLKELCGKEGHYLPTASGVRPLDECRPGADWPERQGPDVGFMGALAASRYQEVRSFWLRRDPQFIEILDGIVDDYAADPSVALEDRFERSPGRERMAYSGFAVLYLEERATYYKRLAALRRIHDLGLKTYGSPEWGIEDWAFELAPLYAGFAPEYDSDLPSVYYHTKINVNVFHVQCFNSANPRVYDVLACGGFLLTEYKPVLEEEFNLGEHLVCFKTHDELRELTEYYLEHDDEREAIARAGQAYALEHCTYQQRVKIVLDALYRDGDAA